MKVMQKVLFTFAIVLGLAFTVSAQKDRPTPPKEDPPVVTPQPKDPPNDAPPEGKKPKKPTFAFVVWKNDTGETA